MLESINVRRFLKVGDTVAVADDLYAGCEPPKFRTPSIGESGTSAASSSPTPTTGTPPSCCSS